jgi:catechol 2,3-dioxygenase-like lactoylglutathione lyase family enzyme
MRRFANWPDALRKSLRGVFAAVLLSILSVALAPAAAEPLVSAVGPVGMTVSDLDTSMRFFTEVLGFETVSETEAWGSELEHLQGVFGLRIRRARLRLGGEEIELTEYLTPRGRPIPADARSNDLWFQHIAIVVRDMDAAYRRLRAHGVRHVSTAPQRLPDSLPAAAGIEAFYFQDGDAHVLELIWFPPGKGDPRWQEPGQDLFLGIDHTAIAVSDTEQSLRFYRDALGLRVAGESLNYGSEQEHLNNVFGARVRITGLRAASGPGIEFLEYLAPRTGRPAPSDLAANDLAHWQTSLTVGALDAAADAARAAGGWWVSPGAVALSDPRLSYRTAALVRDPDGHGLLLVHR